MTFWGRKNVEFVKKIINLAEDEGMTVEEFYGAINAAKELAGKFMVVRKKQE